MISTQNEDTKVWSPFRKEKKERKIKNWKLQRKPQPNKIPTIFVILTSI